MTSAFRLFESRHSRCRHNGAYVLRKRDVLIIEVTLARSMKPFQNGIKIIFREVIAVILISGDHNTKQQ